ncbi:glycosyltransferase family 2 protein [Clostridium butyricum]|uniref:glycosyltransferase family 2 protein n=1 Tax=Clostridium butyricum TaxID=1492 RepID=UPI0007CD8F07|nr:glycosyltransferase family 2 protein [Clostridium butyricum]ANF15279.1 hypothetical protein AZ909_14800 [Clostridium butyricum]AOR95228.1 hypothetical protein BBB49_14360 [Clostridium butyricum]MCI3009512.1 glycosyltransferase family 2 protein [Clostridium butyricum]MDP0841592.1 glycosyltransferase family 2 protein [Clostridium butyricum]RSC95371.1 glycosyltransferase family 2 protein [Clostridium butyricum]
MYRKFKISLIMATLGRESEVDSFILSLLNQEYKNYELVIVDQNENDIVKNIYNKYKDTIIIKYVHTDIKGLSKCRNIGLNYVDGDIIEFPDDDCEYPPKLLNNIVDKFNEDSTMDILTFKSIDKCSLIDSNNKWALDKKRITSLNLLSTVTSYTIFIKNKEDNIIKFDERMGVGEFFGSAEEIDMVSTLIYNGYKGIYTPTLYAYHPIKPDVKERYYKYALGLGAFIKKEVKFRSKFTYCKIALELLFIRPIGGIIFNILKCDKEKIKKYYMVLCGRISGFRRYKI